MSVSVFLNLSLSKEKSGLALSCPCSVYLLLLQDLHVLGLHVLGLHWRSCLWVCVCVLEVLAKLVFLACLLACNCCSVLILLTCFLPCFLACRKHHDHKWPEKWSDLMTQVCWPACCVALLGLIKSPLSLALCASWSAWFDQEISLSMYICIYIYICLYLCWLQDWCLHHPSPLMVWCKESRSAGLLVVLHCLV